MSPAPINPETRARRACVRRSKTASGGLRKKSQNRVWKTCRKPLETRRVARFAWLENASGVRYYGYRYYNPSTGRWLSRDPIEEKGGLNLYTVVRNNPVSFWDRLGLYTLKNAKKSLKARGVAHADKGYIYDSYSDTQIFDEWMRLERANTGWLSELPRCPKKICVDSKAKKAINPNSAVWKSPGAANPEHAGAVYEMRSKPTAGGHANQCSYDANGDIMTSIPAGGTADYASHSVNAGHFLHDLQPWWLAKDLNRKSDYYEVRPVIVE